MSFYIGLSVLSNDETGKICQSTDNVRRRNSRLLSAEAKRILSVFEDISLDQGDIAKETGGRPFFPDGHADFNISHSGSLAAVCYAKGNNPRTGCDVEYIRTRIRTVKTAENFFSSPENRYIFSQGTPYEARFFEIWTLKECYLKLRGLSVFDMAASPSFIRENPVGHKERFSFSFCASVDREISFYLYRISNSAEQYILAAAIEGEEQEPEIRIFSQSPPDCNKIVKIKAAPSPDETVRPNR